MNRLSSSPRRWALATLLASPLIVLSQASAAADAEDNQGRAAPGDLGGRIATYWEALSQRDWATAYALETAALPDADGYLNPFDYAKAKESLPRLTGPTVLGTEVSADSATSILRVLYVIPVGPAVVHSRRYYESRWKRHDGEWLQAEDALISAKELSERYPKIAAEHGIDPANDSKRGAETTPESTEDASSIATSADGPAAEDR